MISKRILNMEPSATSMLAGKVTDMIAAGENIISFNIGEPDFPTPQKIVSECIQSLNEGKTKYTAVSGIQSLKKAICEKLKVDNNLAYVPTQICVSTGAKQALYNAIMTICDPGDEIIILKPCWVSYIEMVKLAQGVPVLIPTKSDYSLELDAIGSSITSKTKAIIINTPNNPTGSVYTKEELLAVGELAVKNGIYIISDEIYEKLIYDDLKHISIAELSDAIYERTITINGFSKAYSMTGWRIGYSAAPIEIANGITSFQSHVTSNSTTFIQWAAIAGLSECSEEIAIMRNEFLKRRDYMLKRLSSIPDIKCAKPGGAFYLMPDVSEYYRKSYNGILIKNSHGFCEYLLDKAKIAIVPGDAFEMPNAVRFSYSTSIENITEGMDRIDAALSQLV